MIININDLPVEEVLATLYKHSTCKMLEKNSPMLVQQIDSRYKSALQKKINALPASIVEKEERAKQAEENLYQSVVKIAYDKILERSSETGIDLDFEYTDLGCGARLIKADLSGGKFDSEAYDRRNGAGCAEKVIRELRHTYVKKNWKEANNLRS